MKIGIGVGVRIGVLFVVVACISGCFRSRTETIGADPNGYLQFTGRVEGSVATVVDHDGRTVMTDVALKPFTSYRTKPGTVEVKVARGGELVVHRKIFVVDGQVAEVHVP